MKSTPIPVRVHLPHEAASATGCGMARLRHAIHTLLHTAGLPVVCTDHVDRAQIIYGTDDAHGGDAVRIPAHPPDDWLADPTFDLDVSSGRTSFDPISVTAALLALDAEDGLRRDRHGRPLPAGHVLFEHDRLHRPVIDGWANALREIFSDHHPVPRWPGEARSMLVLTHDVDYPDIIRWIEALRVLRRGPRGLTLAASILAGRQSFWQFDRLMDLEAARGLRSAFYICPANTDLRGYLTRAPDTMYDLRTPRYREVIGRMRERGFEVGLHTSYEAWRSARSIADEKAVVEDVVGQAITGNRHHYWHLDPDAPFTTLRHHAAAGFRYDSSLGFAHTAGWRCGISVPHRLLDPADDTVLDGLWQLPPALMDDHAFGYLDHARQSTAEELADDVVAGAEEVGGVLVVNLHQRVLNDDLFPGWGGLYERVLDVMERPGWGHATPRDLIGHWSDREDRLLEAERAADA